MFHVVKILLSHARSFKVIENGIPFESLGIVSYLLSISTMAVSLAVSTQYTNVIDRDTQSLHNSIGLR